MITVKEVTNEKMRKEFLDFPLKLYKGNPYFVPPLYSDEKKIFRSDYVYADTCKAVYFNAYEDGRMVGRISGFIQTASNEKHNEKRMRFTRIDGIDSREVFAALFKAVEDWGRAQGMDTICGPLGFSDLEREGLLIDGFDQLSTFEEQYNYDYYMKHIEALGYEKEVDWTESRIYPPDNYNGDLDKIAEAIMKRNRLHLGKAKNVNDFLKKYADKFFKLIDDSYSELYGTVPFTDSMKKMMIDNFKLIIDLRYVAVVLDEQENLVCLGLCFPSIGEAIQKSGGHLTPAALIRLLKAIKHPRIIDFGLIGVDPAYANRGVSVIVSAALLHMLQDDKIEHAETNLNLEDNHAIQNQWKRFKEVKHKRRRSYVKKLTE